MGPHMPVETGPADELRKQSAHLLGDLAYFSKVAGNVLLRLYLPLAAVLVLAHFPYDTDSSVTSEAGQKRSANYYDAAYRPKNQKLGMDYEEAARQAAVDGDVEGTMRRFVKRYGLEDKHVLEVGSGRGYLQDIVPDYTGLDISASVASRYHKPFVVASATAMPFPDSSFDAVWTLWVLEHVPQPEAALREMRRVLKPGGVLFLAVAWNCTPWAADGFDARPFSDFNWRGRLVKASTVVRGSPFFIMAYQLPTRGIRWLNYQLTGADTRLRFRKLEPNYEVYWEADSDAAVSLDRYETYLWFRARGDECLNCLPGEPAQLIWQIHK